MTEELKERIVDVAIEEFTLIGLKFTMNDIARQLGISKKTIYTIFDSKKDVLEGIADRYSADFRRMQEDIEADRSLNNKQKFERILLALPAKYYNIGLNRIYELSDKYPKQYKYLMAAVNMGWQIAEKYLRDGIRCGEFKEVSVPVFMSMVRGTVERFMQSSVLYDNGMTYEQGKQEMVRILMKGIEANE
ncbi:TetR/AcrR family transcriptional regulator [Anaerovoracaceae bacterium Sow4_D4]